MAYCGRVVLGHEKLTDYFMLQYIKASGCNPKKPTEWAQLFDVDLNGTIPVDHNPTWNGIKMNALGKPYKVFSPSYEFRRRDNPDIEVEDITKLNI